MYTDSQLNEAYQQQQETSYTAQDVRDARARLFKASETTQAIEQEIKKPLTRTREAHNTLRNQLNQARQEEDQAHQAFNTVFAQAGWLEAQERRQQRESEQERKRAEQQVERAATIEQEAKQRFYGLYLANGGSPENWEKAWPDIWSSELQRRTLAGQNSLVSSLVSTGRYSM